MLDLNKIIQELEKTNVEIRTTKELKEYGFNDYYIKKAIKEGLLEKIAKGKYKVTKVSKSNQRNEHFKDFILAVFKNDFSKAYDSLLITYQNQINHDYDNHLHIYFLMIEELLEEKQDLRFLENLLEFSEQSSNQSYYQYYIKFRQAVMSSDFEQAYHDIYYFKREELERKGYNNISTKLFYHLAKCILLKRKSSQKEAISISQNNNLYTNLYKEHYRSFINNLEQENYEEAINSLKEAYKYAYPNAKRNINHFINLITTYLELKKEDAVLPEQTINYDALENQYTEIFNKAIEEKDYQTAYQNIGKCIYYNKESSTLRVYRTILQKIIKQNDLNKKHSKNTTIISFTTEEIKKLIYNREYTKVKELLENYLNYEDSRTYYNALKMIKNLEKITNMEMIYDKPKKEYINDPIYPFKRFFEALKYLDYQEAYNLILICEEIMQKRNQQSDLLEFSIYHYLLEDLLDAIKTSKEKLKQLQKLEEINNKLNDLIYKKQLTEEDLLTIETLINEKIKLCKEENLKYNEYTLEIINTLKLIKEKDLDERYFETKAHNRKNLISDFLEAIHEGDYISAYDIIRDENWNQTTANNPNKKYFILYKKLLAQINWNLSAKEASLPNYEEMPIEEESTISHLTNLKTMIKKREYKKAYNYYQENNFEETKRDLNQELEVFLTFIIQTLNKESLEFLKEYKNSLKRGDLEVATSKLNEYQDFIKMNGINRNLDYHQARLTSMKEEINTKDFAKKERLYDQAIYHFRRKEYSEAITILDKYIVEDNDLSAKGYLLRGRAHEHIKEFEKAQNDYQKALSIIPEPNAFYRLGKIYLYRKDYENALSCFLEYEERRPAIHKMNLYDLSSTYRILGDMENAKKYSKIAHHIKYKRD